MGDMARHDPSSLRRPPSTNDFALNRDAIRWLAQLPDEVRPIELGRQFPRIINTIAAKWVDFIGCRRYLNSLQIDERGGRQGFPFVIVQEICTLREYFDSLYPPEKDLWQKAIDAGKR
ncbi:hypothetical protein ACI2TJ_05195 [Ralstonia nicotianae]